MKKILFTHAPKTAGTHIHKVLSAIVDKNFVNAIEDIPTHAVYRYDDVNIQNICVLRNPFDQILSHFIYKNRRIIAKKSIKCNEIKKSFNNMILKNLKIKNYHIILMNGGIL
jgi:hypothetical protein